MLAACLPVLSSLSGAIEEVIPPAPQHYVEDAAGVLSAATEKRLNAQLEAYERSSSNQLVVALYRHMQSPSSVEDYTVRIAHQWGVGQKDKDNGAVLFVFVQDRKMFLQVGYGLEPRLTDAEAFRIIEGLKPYFRSGDYDGGISWAVDRMIEATEGEYQGDGRTAADRESNTAGVSLVVLILFVLFFMVLFRSRSGRVYTDRGVRRYDDGGWGGGWGGGSGGSFGGGGFGGGGGFSGGGGGFGGGGAGGSW
ncbi:MAG: TPM domain-containing protein [Verrucomicrobiales bacterium]|nr:TPM domain-containing protein [Verrucomicrobiales bacterium]